MKKIMAAVAALLLFAAPSFAANSMAQAEKLGKMLIEEITPESLTLKISDGSSFVYAVAKGAKIHGFRIDTMRLRAMLANIPNDPDETQTKLEDLIISSEGEIVLNEKDVNDYFKGAVNTKGFSNLDFDFTPNGYTAQGTFKMKLIFNISMRLRAEGILALRSDGLYLDKTTFYISGAEQTESLVNYIEEKINPLLPFSKIPFPVRFKRIVMTDSYVMATADPQPLDNGETWTWKK